MIQTNLTEDEAMMCIAEFEICEPVRLHNGNLSHTFLSSKDYYTVEYDTYSDTYIVDKITSEELYEDTLYINDYY